MNVDYIVVGGGSAGCLLAARLSENPAHQVLLIEAGGTNQSPFVQIPFMTIFTMPFWFKNWHYRTTPQTALNHKTKYMPRGKVLGGSSAINAMIYIRGQAEDYDQWAKTTSADWSWQSVLPVFKALESNQSIHDKWHGQTGPLSVSPLMQTNPASLAFVQAGVGCGYPENRDFNGAQQLGVGLYQVTQKKGHRHSAADAFLSPALSRPNLRVLTHATALNLLMDGKRCLGVKVRHRNSIMDCRAAKEVILTAGSINSPQLLLLSGIGPAEELAKHGIPLVHELPGVGLNFHDHPDYVHCYRSRNPNLLGFTPSGIWQLLKAFNQYRRTGQGIMTTNFAEAGAFLSTDPASQRPDTQLHFIVGLVDKHVHKFHFSRGMSCHVCLLRPKSRGRISLKSANPLHAPAIDPNFLGDERDLQLMVKAYRQSLAIMEHEALAAYRGRSLYPAQSEEDIIRLLRQRTETIYHPVGSCKMGTDELAVVDPQLRVHGIEALRVADASVMPEIISGNTNAPTMVIAEMAARYILNQ